MRIVIDQQMPKRLKSPQIVDSIRERFSVSAPLFLAADKESIKLELKPYLRPFERDLAVRELRALVDVGDEMTEELGYYIVRTSKSEEFFRQRLTYWQRAGRVFLEPTVQKALELTQNGLSSLEERRDLHNARRLRYGPHNLHEYRGKFFPQLVRSLMNISGVSEDGIVLDPMCGSGTTPCEALASGRSAIAVDMNPLSVLIASVKSATVLQEPELFVVTISERLKDFRFGAVDPASVWREKDLAYLRLWFDPAAIQDLASLLSEVNRVADGYYRDFFRVCISNIVRSVSWQKDTDLRVRKEVKRYEPGEAIARFRQEVAEQRDRIYPYLCVLPKVSPKAVLSVRRGNAIQLAKVLPEYCGKVNLLVTSPPYAMALPYLDTDRLSLVILGLLSRVDHKEAESLMVGTREVSERERGEAWSAYLVRKHELPDRVTDLIDHIATHNHGDSVGFRRRNLPALLGRYFIDMLDAMRSARSLMAPGACGIYIVGNNSTLVGGENKMAIPTDQFLFEIGAKAGWRARETMPMELLVSRDIFKENRGSAETILYFDA